MKTFEQISFKANQSQIKNSILDNSLYSIVYHTEYTRVKDRERDKRKKRNRRAFLHLVFVHRLTPVSDNVHAADHLTDSEETNDLRGGDTGQGDLLLVGVAHAGQQALGGGQVEALEVSGVARGVDQGLKVGLEGGQVAEGCYVSVGLVLVGLSGRVDGHTEESCAGRGRPGGRGQCRLSSSKP